MNSVPGGEVVVDAETWKTKQLLSWRAEPMSLREVLDGVCEKTACVFRVRNGRIFLIHP